MTKVATTIRCVPRFGYQNTEVRAVCLDLPPGAEENEIHDALARWFLQRGIADAVFAIEVDDDGFFAVVNDEAFDAEWGKAYGL